MTLLWRLPWVITHTNSTFRFHSLSLSFSLHLFSFAFATQVWRSAPSFTESDALPFVYCYMVLLHLNLIFKEEDMLIFSRKTKNASHSSNRQRTKERKRHKVRNASANERKCVCEYGLNVLCAYGLSKGANVSRGEIERITIARSKNEEKNSTNNWYLQKDTIFLTNTLRIFVAVLSSLLVLI